MMEDPREYVGRHRADPEEHADTPRGYRGRHRAADSGFWGRDWRPKRRRPERGNADRSVDSEALSEIT